MEHKVIIVGIGPGAPDYLLPAALKKIQQARVLAGGKRALATFGREDVQQIQIDGNLSEVLHGIREALPQSDVTVLVSGDPGFYSLLPAIRRSFPSEIIEVVPGISSVQVAFARIGLPWQEAYLTSVHGREVAGNPALGYIPGKILGLLTDPVHNPSFLAAHLLEQGWPQTAKVWLCENLSYDSERILALSLAEIKSVAGFESCVMVVQG
ncbi:precorrin-6y C5,15-methyltransferase (decarboxylating) subunit CbiE [Acetonema longum]|uniref:Precorrin-6y C5,15-methyltransferase (Decarboxylating), CbiE subunit n=1 Tax=Acetonema longum DSM 6540 TaxID=1009370 RepID=F7NPW8_9FIRM|nr:precorrin-6y C5,15-methyltransferase (decarboxylating) subunit CbiE [Acetonema longum]EGO61959.1 precorrin-6y C5,15-methyltransferase (decarboxylating), CbiE subunit [Acetonema longum DSM 6540]